MRIIIQDGLSANHYIRLAWSHAFTMLGHEVHLWNKEGKSPHDLLDEFPANIFIGDTYQLTRGLVKALIKHKDVKTIFCASQWGKQHDQEVDKKRFPLLFVTEEEKRLLEQLKKETGKPDYVFNYYTQTYADFTHGGWKELGVTPIGMPLSANLSEYSLTPPSKEHTADIVFCGNRWPYKSRTMDQVLLPLCYEQLNLKVLIFGNGWSNPECVGNASSNTVRNYYASAKVCPNLYEEHSLVWGYDLNSRLFQVSACGGFQISQLAKSAKEEIFSNNEIIFAEGPKDFIEKTLYYVKFPNERIPFIRKAVDTVYKHHTNIHRASQFFELLGFPEDAAKAANVAEENYNQIKLIINSPKFDKRYSELY